MYFYNDFTGLPFLLNTVLLLEGIVGLVYKESLTSGIAFVPYLLMIFFVASFTVFVATGIIQFLSPTKKIKHR